MKLDDTNQYIKDNIQNIIDGKFDDKFSSDQLKMMLEFSFLYNHISFEFDTLTFEYNDIIVKVSNISDLMYSNIPISEDQILSIIRNEAEFKSAYTSFLRDIKINNILE